MKWAKLVAILIWFTVARISKAVARRLKRTAKNLSAPHRCGRSTNKNGAAPQRDPKDIHK